MEEIQEEVNHTYVLMALSWEYDDEHSTMPDGEPGSPVAVFANREEAEAEMKHREDENWKFSVVGSRVGEWYYDSYADNHGEHELEEARKKIIAVFPKEELDADFDLDAWEVPKCNKKQLKVLQEVLSGIYFTKIVEVPSY